MENQQLGNLSKQQKMMLLRSRYRCVADLWTYLTERSKLIFTYIYLYSWPLVAIAQRHKNVIFTRYS